MLGPHTVKRTKRTTKGRTVAFHSRQVPISSKNNRAARYAHAKASEQFKTYDTSAIKPKRSKAPVIIATAVAVVLILIAFFLIRSCAFSVELLPEGEEAVLTVEQGEGAREIAQDLQAEHLIANAGQFVDLVNSRDAAGSLIPGVYLFKGGATQEEILDALLVGPASTGTSVTIPEGYTLDDIAQAIAEATNGRISTESFLAASADAAVYVTDYPFLIEAGNNSLEGYLFPKTYSISPADDAKAVVRMMLDQFQIETADLDWAYPQSQGLDEYDVLKLASIVEKESNADSMATIASVFYNRLASDRPYLESDATTAYEVGHDPTPEDVHANTPYSTYTNAGLPPTPICNPSLAAIQAVCSPDATDYLFFFTNDDGSHAFTRTYDEHQATFN